MGCQISKDLPPLADKAITSAMLTPSKSGRDSSTWISIHKVLPNMWAMAEVGAELDGIVRISSGPSPEKLSKKAWNVVLVLELVVFLPQAYLLRALTISLIVLLFNGQVDDKLASTTSSPDKTTLRTVAPILSRPFSIDATRQLQRCSTNDVDP